LLKRDTQFHGPENIAVRGDDQTSDKVKKKWGKILVTQNPSGQDGEKKRRGGYDPQIGEGGW